MEYLLRPDVLSKAHAPPIRPPTIRLTDLTKSSASAKPAITRSYRPSDESRSHHAVQLNFDCRIFKRRPAVGVALRTSAWRVICAAPPLRLAFALANDAQFSCQDFYHSPSGGGVYGQGLTEVKHGIIGSRPPRSCRSPAVDGHITHGSPLEWQASLPVAVPEEMILGGRLSAPPDTVRHVRVFLLVELVVNIDRKW